MRLLIIGGTIFLGRHIVEAALAQGHTITLFNRGQHNPELFPDVEKLAGDRDGNLSALEGRRWDAVIDTCGYLPRVVRQSVQLLRGATDHYTFISTISVYPDPTIVGIDETAGLATLEDESTEELTGETYGGLKVLCEREVEHAFGDRALILRPGLIVGPHDPTDRFTYWPHRVAQGGDVLAPGRPQRGVQFIDVRDLAEWTIAMIEVGRSGVYNADGPEHPVAMGDLLGICKHVSASDARFVWVPDDFLLEQGVGAWMEMPLWLPESAAPGFFAFDSSKAIAAGLQFRPLAETVLDTLDWNVQRPPTERQAGMMREREAEVLQAWKTREPA